MEVTLLLCDAATVAEGKLSVLGAGWNIIQLPDVPFNSALGAICAFDWSEANSPHNIEAVLMTDDGEVAEIQGNPVKVTARVEVGRPPGLKPGTNINAPLAFNFNQLSLPAGGYRFEIHANGDIKATAPFRVGMG